MKTYIIYSSYKDLPNTWDSLVIHDIFLQTKYLQAIEEALPINIQLFYIGVFVEDKLVGLALIQRVQLYLKDMFRNHAVSCIKDFFKDQVSKVLKGNILVIGNLTHTGQHGLFYQKEAIAQLDFLKLIYEAINTIKANIKLNENKKIRVLMLKDFFIDDSIDKERAFLDSHKIHRVMVQPNMVLPIQPDWLKKEDYKACLNKKYRDRYKRARKNLNSIVCKELDLNTIQKRSKKLHSLYLNVSDNATFNTFILPENHFYSLKLQLQDKFKVFGYYLEDKLIGFYTLILNNKSLETYFLGYDIEHQIPNQLYLNMLYNMTEFAIEHGFTQVIYARTAMEIKSSVGAKPKAMVIYLKHTNGFINVILKQIFSLMNPKQDWVERHPFL
ncbi:GNAT family N-acetyltransferase [Pseudalgibacter alginicilyticus]|uniref:GNAT family N-acetyltransferase n=1 Tax=Pseudalgibacter alginicilyticus TaxID=1736674 RepID=UPI000B0D9DD6|nr:GNAT family N-acetyltransferase [Pseudalgibacter alginicilyticus]